MGGPRRAIFRGIPQLRHKFFADTNTKTLISVCPCCFPRLPPFLPSGSSHNSRNPRYTSSTPVLVVLVTGACRRNMPAAVQDAFYPLSSGHAEISLRRYASVETRANVTRMEKGEKNQKPFPIVVISPVPFNGAEVPRYFRFCPAPRIASLYSFFFISFPKAHRLSE